MAYKDWKQYDPEHLQDIQNNIDDPYSHVPKQDVIFLMHRLQQSHDSHYFTLNCLKGVLEQLKSGVDRNVVISDIEQYVKDLGGVE